MVDKPLKILVVGREISNFLCPLFRQVKEQYGHQVDVLELRDKEQTKKCAYDVFDNVLDVSLSAKGYSKSALLSSALSGEFLNRLLRKGDVKESMKLTVINNAVKKIISNYDVVHVFFLTPEVSMIYEALASAKWLVVSFWGSDLMQNNEAFVYESHKKLVDRADRVSVHQKEMKEVFLAKFGRHHIDKLTEMLLITDVRCLHDYINALPKRNEYISSFKKKHNISENKRIVVIGHSAHKFDNHAEIIKMLQVYKDKLVDKVCLVFPMTYSSPYPEYIDLIEDYCKESGFDYRILREYLTTDELVEFRMASEILLRLSSYDAFSLALSEGLCTRSVLITGTWLPYGKLRGNDVYYEEVYDMEQGGQKLVDVVNDYNSYYEKCRHNPENVLRVFENEKSPEKVNNMYQY